MWSPLFLQIAKDADIGTEYGLQKTVEAVKNVRQLTKKDMILNAATPDISVDPETYIVKADGLPLTCLPADRLPLAQNYFLF